MMISFQKRQKEMPKTNKFFNVKQLNSSKKEEFTQFPEWISCHNILCLFVKENLQHVAIKKRKSQSLFQNGQFDKSWYEMSQN